MKRPRTLGCIMSVWARVREAQDRSNEAWTAALDRATEAAGLSKEFDGTSRAYVMGNHPCRKGLLLYEFGWTTWSNGTRSWSTERFNSPDDLWEWAHRRRTAREESEQEVNPLERLAWEAEWPETYRYDSAPDSPAASFYHAEARRRQVIARAGVVRRHLLKALMHLDQGIAERARPPRRSFDEGAGFERITLVTVGREEITVVGDRVHPTDLIARESFDPEAAVEDYLLEKRWLASGHYRQVRNMGLRRFVQVRNTCRWPQ